MHTLAAAVLTALSFVSTARAASSSSAAIEPLPTSMLEHKVAYFKVGQFTPEVTGRIRATMQSIAAQKPRGVILDLRDSSGGDVNTAHAIIESLLPKGTPYMRSVSPLLRTINFTTQIPVLKKSTPVVVLRNARTLNESDIVVYVLQKLRKAVVVELSPTRNALKRAFKQNPRMANYHPIKEGVFFVSPDARVIKSEGGDESDMIPRAIGFVRELSPWDEVKTARK